VLIDKEGYEKILKEVFKNKLSTPAILCERFHITASLAKKILTNLCEKNVIKHHENPNRNAIYTKK
jgi:ribosomal protein S25